MSPRRVFKGHPDRPQRIAPVVQAETIDDGELTLLIQESRKRLSKSSCKLIERLCRMPPAIRLSVNLKVLLEIIGRKNVQDVLRDGLAPHEKDTLIEMQVRDMTPRARELAHALLCIDERVAFVGSMGPAFKDLTTRKGGYIQNGQSGTGNAE